MASDLGCGPGWNDLLHARSLIVSASRAAGLAPPVDGVFLNLADSEGLRKEALASRRLGFFGKSTLDPTQVAAINEVFART
jgi:citrate lyase subunit beta / citryl-CoA lyase